MTRVSFSLSRPGLTRLAVYDPTGRLVADLIPSGRLSGWKPNLRDASGGGKYSVVWNAEGMAAGSYFLNLSAGDRTSVQKVTLIK